MKVCIQLLEIFKWLPFFFYLSVGGATEKVILVHPSSAINLCAKSGCSPSCSCRYFSLDQSRGSEQTAITIQS